MSFVALLGETATVVRFGAAADEYGNIVRGAATRVSYPARLEQLRTEEIVRDRDTVTADWRVFLPAFAEVSPYDRLEARSHIFEVTGLPDEQHTPAGAHHLEVKLRFVA